MLWLGWCLRYLHLVRKQRNHRKLQNVQPHNFLLLPQYVKPLLLLSVTQSTKNRQEVEHPDLSIQPLQSRIPALPTIPRPGAQVTAPTTDITTNLSCAPCHFGTQL